MDRKPTLANQFQVQTPGTVVIEYDGRTEKVTSDGEQELTNGLIKVVQGKQHKVYFVQGHGEKSHRGHRIAAATARSARRSTSDNFLTDKLVLAQQKDVPADASVLVVAGPKTDFFPAEIDMLKRYLAKGGKILFLLDPPDRADAPEVTNIAALLKDWGIEIGTNVVVDVSGMGQLLGTDVSVPVAAKYDPHPITERFNLLTAYPLARSVTADRGRYRRAHGAESRRHQREQLGGKQHQGIDHDRQGRARVGQGRQGGARVARRRGVGARRGRAAARGCNRSSQAGRCRPNLKRGSRCSATRTSSPTATSGFPGNRDLFLNTVNWLAQQENLISIRPREAGSSARDA